jgi:hypothetical protein
LRNNKKQIKFGGNCMKKFSLLISIFVLFSLLAGCAGNEPLSNVATDANKIETIVAGTLAAIPTLTPAPLPSATHTPIPLTPTGIPVQTLAPLYSEVTWENLGPSEQEILLNQQTNEKITLSGNSFQAALPSEKNDLVNNVNLYYYEENMANMGWILVSGWGGATGLLTEFYNETGYFLTVRFNYGESPSIIVWISDETTVVPVLPAK